MFDGDFLAKLEMRRARRTIKRNDTDSATALYEEVGKVADDAFNAADESNVIDEPCDAFCHAISFRRGRDHR